MTAPMRHLNQLASLVILLLLVFAVVFGLVSWTATRDDHLHQMRNVLELSEKALDNYFLQSESALHGLALDIAAANGLNDLPATRRLLRRYHDLHPTASAVVLTRVGGQVAATSLSESTAGLPNQAEEPSFQASLAEQSSTSALTLGRPMLGKITHQWVFPMRYTMRDDNGSAVAYLTVAWPVALLQSFWRSAPVIQNASIGLLRDDGYLISRYPVPPFLGNDQVYGAPRQGALRTHLVKSGLPARGYVEGLNQTSGVVDAHAFMRLEHYPVTLFITIPVAVFREVWWSRTWITYLLIGLFAAITLMGYRVMARRLAGWESERLNHEQQRLLSEGVLRKNESEQRFLLDHLVAGVVVHGPDGTILDANPQARKLLGVSECVLEGLPLREGLWHLLREDGSEMTVDDYPLSQALRSRRPVSDVVIGVKIAATHSVVWLLCSFDPDLDEQGELLRIVLTFVDVSARRNAEQTVLRREEEYRMLVENSIDGVILGRSDGRIMRANPAACRMFDRSEAELQAIGQEGILDKEDPRLRTLLERRAQTGRAHADVTGLRRDGARFDVEVSSTVFATGTGEMTTSLILHDNSDRRRAEAAQAAREVAETANLAKSRFLAQMSHELRTPLTAIMGFSDVLRLERRSPLSVGQREQVGHIHAAGKHLLAMIDDLLYLSQIESGTLRLSPTAVDPVELLRQAVRELGARAESAQVSLELDLPVAPVGCTLCDATRLKQVVLNLLSNAIKYNSPGGLAALGLVVEQERLVISVSDTGLGMSAEQLGGLFQPFNRLGREDSGIEGAGIGLVITKRLVEAMGGELSVTSEAGVGSAFRIDLPFLPVVQDADEPDPEFELATGDATANNGRRCRVLYIDDEPLTRMMVGALLALRPDVAATLAASGGEGIAQAVATTPDLVLVDIMMPTMNGFDVLKAIRAQRSLRHTRCLAVSANAMPDNVSAALAAGFDGFLTKPVPAAVLYGEIDATCLESAGLTRLRL